VKVTPKQAGDFQLTLRLNLNNALHAFMKNNPFHIDRKNRNPRAPRLAKALARLLTAAACLQTVGATDRLFTYSYEPETMPQGAMEFEQWVTLRAGRTKNIGEENYNRWDIREEFEYGVTDRYTLALYLNTKAESFRDSMGNDQSDFSWEGISLENIYNVLNPATHPVGLSFYVEGTYSGSEAEIEEKIIIGQRHGDWKWALNLINETEWEDNLSEIEGKVEATAGIARHLGKNWALGLEVRNVNILPDYNEWESSAIYLGPVVSYHEEKWWAALTVMPQIWGKNYDGGGDGDPTLDLVHNERLSIRLIFGIGF
jgi:hypothetical protein